MSEKGDMMLEKSGSSTDHGSIKDVSAALFKAV